MHSALVRRGAPPRGKLEFAAIGVVGVQVAPVAK
jgi:hypothetical protein